MNFDDWLEPDVEEE